MNIRVFNQFLRIVEARSISKAALGLGISQPSLTKIIHELERDLGAGLLRREGHGVRATESGERFFRWATEIDALLQRMRSDISGESDRLLIKQLTIGVLPSVARSLAVSLVKNLQQTYPNAELRILEGVTGHLVEWLADQRLDLAIFYDHPAAQHFEPKPLVTQPMYLVGSPAACTLPARVPFASLSDKPLILASRHVGNRREFEAVAAQHKISLRVAIEADSLPAMIQLVADGMGYTILPIFAVHKEVAEGRLIASPIVGPTIERTLVMAARNRPVQFAGMSALIEEVRNSIQAAA